MRGTGKLSSTTNSLNVMHLNNAPDTINALGITNVYTTNAQGITDYNNGRHE